LTDVADLLTDSGYGQFSPDDLFDFRRSTGSDFRVIAVVVVLVGECWAIVRVAAGGKIPYLHGIRSGNELSRMGQIASSHFSHFKLLSCSTTGNWVHRF
jgi:hypothetical protein